MAKAKSTRRPAGKTKMEAGRTKPVTTHHERDTVEAPAASARGTADLLGAREADRRPVQGRVISEEHTGHTKAHGLASPNPRLHPGHTSDLTGFEGDRAAQPRLRPGRTSGTQPLPPLNPNPRSAATSRSSSAAEGAGILEDPMQRAERVFQERQAEGPGPKVMATQMGYYDHIRRRPGDVFRIRGTMAADLDPDHDPRGIGKDEDPNDPDVRRRRRAARERAQVEGAEYADFSPRWMQVVDENTPDRVTLGNEDLKRQHDETLLMRNDRNATGDAAQHAQQGIQVGRDDVDNDIADDGANAIDRPAPRRSAGRR